MIRNKIFSSLIALSLLLALNSFTLHGASLKIQTGGESLSLPRGRGAWVVRVEKNDARSFRTTGIPHQVVSRPNTVHLTVTSQGNLIIRRVINGSTTTCLRRERLSAENLRRLGRMVAAANPSAWSGVYHGPFEEDAPVVRLRVTLRQRDSRGAERERSSSLIQSVEMPGDLAAIADFTSTLMDDALERCRN